MTETRSIQFTNILHFRVDTQRYSQSLYEVESYITKTTNALNKIAEKHWKLQMKQEESEEAEKVYIKATSTVYTVTMDAVL